MAERKKKTTSKTVKKKNTKVSKPSKKLLEETIRMAEIKPEDIKKYEEKKKKEETKKETPKKSTTKKTTKTATKKTTAKKETAKKTTSKKTTTTKKSTVKKTTTPKEKSKKVEEAKQETKTVKTKDEQVKKESNTFKVILKYIKIVLAKIWIFLVFIFTSIGKFFKWLWEALKEIDRKDEEKKKQRRLAKGKPINDLNDIDADIDRDDLELLSYKGQWNKIGIFFKNRGRVLKFDMKKFNKRLKYGTLRDKILIVLMLFLIFSFIAFIALIIYVVITAPNIDKDRLYKENSTVLYDKNGVEFARIGTENREKVTYDDLPQVLVDAIVATEDSRFFQHNGLDMARFFKAGVGQVLGRSDAGGGSTLTMQLSKNSATSSQSHGIKGIIRKFQDIYLAVFVYEKKYTKEQIMEFYVNNAYLGAAYGVQQASRAYYGKDVSDLNLSEAAMIAGLFQLPYSYNPYNHPVAAEKRRNTVLNLMERHGYITAEERDAAKSVPIKSLLAGYNSELNENVRFIDTVVEEVLTRTGYDPYQVSMEIYTTMDTEKQKYVNMIQNGQFKELKSDYKYKNEYSDNGIAVVSVSDGSIMAIGSGRNKKSERSFNYATDGRRHPGSTAKPVVDYGPAIEYLGWGSGNTVIDRPYEYSSGGKFKNWDNKYDGVTTAKKALARSRNIPALLTFKQTTNEQKLKMATDLGWKLETSGDTILETCSIGGFTGVTPLEAAAAYAAFARGGTYIEPYSFTKVKFNETGDEYIVYPKKTQAMSEETAYIITDILEYAVTSGTVSVSKASGSEIASKTGTSTVDSNTLKRLGIKGSIDGDVWQIAYTQDMAISLWYSYPTLSKEHYLTQTEGSKSRKAIMQLLTKYVLDKNAHFRKPSGITYADIELETDPLQLASEYTPKELRSKEIFNKNSVPTEKSERFSKLESPKNLHYAINGNQVNLSWDAVATPDAVNTEAIKKYFTDSKIYNYWADEMIQNRINYNNSSIGNFGYEVFINDASGSRSLGFVTDNKFTYTGSVSSGTSFSVKSSYSIFKANQSNPTTISISGGSTPSPQEDKSIKLTLPACINKTEIINLMSQNKDLMYLSGVEIKSAAGDNLKNSFSTSLTINNCDGDCATKIEQTINSDGQFNASFTATSKGYNAANQSTVIKNNC